MSERIQVIGLVGGIGSGKSTLARELASRRNVVVIDADRIGHDALKQPEIKQKLRRYFGDDIFDTSGDVARPALAGRIFGDSATKRKDRAALEAIVHPVIREEIIRLIDAARRGGAQAAVLDAAVMFEAGWDAFCDAVVFVDVPLPVRLNRVADRGWDGDRLNERESSQLSLSEKRARADDVVDNSGEPASAVAALEGILDRLLALQN